jgi:hypothetical protein
MEDWVFEALLVDLGGVQSVYQDNITIFSCTRLIGMVYLTYKIIIPKKFYKKCISDVKLNSKGIYVGIRKKS